MTLLFELDHCIQPVLRTNAAEDPSEFAMLRYLGLYKQTHLFFINSTREEYLGHFKCVLSNARVVTDVIVIIGKSSGQGMIVGNHEILLRKVRAFLKFEHVSD